MGASVSLIQEIFYVTLAGLQKDELYKVLNEMLW